MRPACSHALEGQMECNGRMPLLEAQGRAHALRMHLFCIGELGLVPDQERKSARFDHELPAA